MDPNALIAQLDRWQPIRVLVVGDFMLDRHTYGNAQRLSPDAPVPVLHVEKQTQTPGGAANVCLDLAALQCHVQTLGLVGDDEPGCSLASDLQKHNIQTQGLIVSADRPTTVKQSLVGLAQHRHPQKMFRLDTEARGDISVADEKALLDKAKSLITQTDVLCLEDYAKGVLTPSLCQALIALAHEHDVPVLVDPPAAKDLSKYRGATCMTPNRSEAQLATGMPDSTDPKQLAKLGQTLMEQLELDTLVLTLDRQGAMLFEKQSEPTLIPTRARSVYDVTGAGDMVLAMLAGARGNGMDWSSAVVLANIAAGLEVERFGVVPIELDEILLSLLAEAHGQTKLRTLESLRPEIRAHKKAGKKIAFTNGCFDILHAGHVSYLRQARQTADLLILGLNTDESIKRLKGNDRPVNHQDDRVLVISELQSVDYVVLFDEDTPIELIRAIEPDVLVKGADYQKHEVVGHDIVEAAGGKVELVPLVEGRSTTNIIAKMAEPTE